jgi:Rieske Fe-S protein
MILMTFSCKKDVFHFPFVPIHLDLGIYSDLGQLGPGGSLFKDGYGVKGLIIYRDFDNNYYVYDRACTFEKDFSCKVNKYETWENIMECPCCKSRFAILEGSAYPNNGPATYPLRQYKAFIDGDFLKIVN